MHTLSLLAFLLASGCGDTTAAVAPSAPERAETETATDEPTAETVTAPVALEDADPTPYSELSDWIGEYSVSEDGTHFVLQPAVRPFIEEAFGVEPGLMDRLSNLDEEPYYLTTPIEYVGGAFALEFIPNGRMNADGRTLHMLIDGETGATFAVLKGDDGDTYYRASYDARVAVLEDDAVYWMSDASGEDFATMAMDSENTPISP